MRVPAVESSVENTAIGRIVVPPNVPPGFALFYTTIDFHGRIDDALMRFVRDRLGREMTLITCNQVHGTTLRRANRETRAESREPQCDALWSDEKRTALAIKVADCLALSLIDPRNSVIANIHSGWRGTVQGITASTLDAVPLDPTAAFAYLGPSIRVCCFEVGEEVAAQFDGQFVDRTRGAKPHVDIAAYTVSILASRGFAEERIVDTKLCTRCGEGVTRLLGYSVPGQPSNSATEQPLFHSYRRDGGRGGRNLAIVAQ
jgi:purine-nucleoside/S-methyl-5'-thioadenosine phosphorylase / adenosine deaminase